MIGDMPIVLEWDGDDYPACRTEISATDRLVLEGMQDQYSLSVYVRRADLTAGIPQVSDTVEIGAKKYRVLSVKTDSSSRMIRLDLGSEFDA